MINAQLEKLVENHPMIFIKKFCLMLLALLFISHITSRAQSPEGVRPITVTTDDSIVKTFIYDRPLKKNVREGYVYFWYYDGMIHHNQGDFSGKLLHGKYETFDNQHRLLVKGILRYGVKQGVWTRWNENGTVKESYTFKNGRLEGPFKVFNATGKPLMKGQCKNDLLNGKVIYFVKDSMIIKRFREGKELLPKVYKRCILKPGNKRLPTGSKMPSEEKPKKGTCKWKLFPFSKKPSPEKQSLENITNPQTQKSNG